MRPLGSLLGARGLQSTIRHVARNCHRLAAAQMCFHFEAPLWLLRPLASASSGAGRESRAPIERAKAAKLVSSNALFRARRGANPFARNSFRRAQPQVHSSCGGGGLRTMARAFALAATARLKEPLRRRPPPPEFNLANESERIFCAPSANNLPLQRLQMRSFAARPLFAGAVGVSRCELNRFLRQRQGRAQTRLTINTASGCRRKKCRRCLESIIARCIELPSGRRRRNQIRRPRRRRPNLAALGEHLNAALIN